MFFPPRMVSFTFFTAFITLLSSNHNPFPTISGPPPQTPPNPHFTHKKKLPYIYTHLLWRKGEEIIEAVNRTEAMRGGLLETRSSSSCAACKLLKRRCSPTCIFAPHFRSDEPKKFAKVHKVFGASNVSKILTEVPEEHREDTVSSLAYEAEVRLKDPVYGCIGAIALLQRKMVELEQDLAVARARLARLAPNNSSSCSSSSSSSSGAMDEGFCMSLCFPELGCCSGLNQYGCLCELGQIPYPFKV